MEVCTRLRYEADDEVEEEGAEIPLHGTSAPKLLRRSSLWQMRGVRLLTDHFGEVALERHGVNDWNSQRSPQMITDAQIIYLGKTAAHYD